MASERLDATNAVFGVCRQTRYRALLEVEKELKEVAKARMSTGARIGHKVE
jgi:hypothetical protein